MTKSKKLIVSVSVFAVLAALVIGMFVYSFSDKKVSRELEIAEAQEIVEEALNDLPKNTAKGAVKVMESVEIKVNSISYGNEKNAVLDCEYSGINISSVISEHKQALIDFAYKTYREGREAGKMQNATKICLAVSNSIDAYLDDAEISKGKITLNLYETDKGVFTLHLSDEIIDKCTGGILSAAKEIDGMKTAYFEGKPYDITNSSTIRTGIKDCFSLKNYDSDKPQTGNFLTKWCLDIADEFERNFIENNKWIYLVEGLGTTLAITALAGLMGIILGFIVAIIRCTNETTGRFKIVDKICRFYLTVVRGTPVMVQLLIIYFVMLLPLGVPKFISAILCFGLNSGAYVAEIVRGGIMSVDKGQNEAGRSLGFNFSQTMIHFIIPQAFKAVLPALANEFITLLKESSVAFYIGVADLTQGGLKIRSITYSNFMPLIAVALIYLAIVLIMTKLVGLLERRLRKSDH